MVWELGRSVGGGPTFTDFRLYETDYHFKHSVTSQEIVTQIVRMLYPTDAPGSSSSLIPLF